MLSLDSKKTIWNLIVAVASDWHAETRTSRHSMISSRLGAEPSTSQKTFCAAPATGNRSSHHGAIKVGICRVGRPALAEVVNPPVKLALPLALTKTPLNRPPPNGIGNGEPTKATASSSRFRLTPAIVR